MKAEEIEVQKRDKKRETGKGIKITWETYFLMLVAGRSLGRSLILWASEGESMMGSVENCLGWGKREGLLFLRKLLAAAINGVWSSLMNSAYPLAMWKGSNLVIKIRGCLLWLRLRVRGRERRGCSYKGKALVKRIWRKVHPYLDWIPWMFLDFIFMCWI